MNFVDILCLTQPDAVTGIHDKYLARPVRTSSRPTLSARARSASRNSSCRREIVREINEAAVRCARIAAEKHSKLTPDRPRFVAGSIGPTTKQTAISTDVEDPGFRGATFDQMAASYYEQVAALVDAGVDILMPETVIDTLNLKGVSVRDPAVYRRDRSSCSGHGLDHLQRGGRDLCVQPER